MPAMPAAPSRRKGRVERPAPAGRAGAWWRLLALGGAWWRLLAPLVNTAHRRHRGRRATSVRASITFAFKRAAAGARCAPRTRRRPPLLQHAPLGAETRKTTLPVSQHDARPPAAPKSSRGTAHQANRRETMAAKAKSTNARSALFMLPASHPAALQRPASSVTTLPGDEGSRRPRPGRGLERRPAVCACPAACGPGTNTRVQGHA